MEVGAEGFGEDVRNVVGGGDVGEVDVTCLDELADVVELPVNVLQLVVVDRIFGEGNGAHVVVVDGGGGASGGDDGAEGRDEVRELPHGLVDKDGLAGSVRGGHGLSASGVERAVVG